MTEFWEKNFQEKQEMWGFEPAYSAQLASERFAVEGISKVLIPGIGYGRNAGVFTDKGMEVTGIEISQTAIEMAKKYFGSGLTLYHGSVTDMPFNKNLYEGIFCYALIHLLDGDERAKLVRDCYRQLSDNGLMIFTVITKDAPTYGQGAYLSKDRYEMFGGVNIFFYDEESVHAEFGQFGLIDITMVTENYPFFVITCRKIKT